MIELYICDSHKRMADGTCNGFGCINDTCFLTKDKKYAKEVISIFEAEKYFEHMIELYTIQNDMEKVNQYFNALKSIRETIKEFKQEAEEKEGVFIDCIYEQIELFEDMLDVQ